MFSYPSLLILGDGFYLTPGKGGDGETRRAGDGKNGKKVIFSTVETVVCVKTKPYQVAA
jgi:hypothetical protein